jgi:capsular exopolysaccharide synthesis family protein
MMLTEHPLLHRIQQILEAKKTGLLPLVKEDKKITLYIRNGLIDGASSDIAALHLDRILNKKGILITSDELELLEKAHCKRTLWGRSAPRFKRLEENTELKEGVHTQILNAMTFALVNDFEARAFRDVPIDMYVPAKIDHNRLLLELVRVNPRPIQLDPNRMLALKNGNDLSHFEWYPQELSVLNQLKTPCKIQDLSAATGINYTDLNKVLYVLNALKLIQEVEPNLNPSAVQVKNEGLPFEHLIPKIGNSDLSDKLETFNNPSSFISEQFKNLKVRIAEAAAQAPLHVLAISSAQSGDGKSLICANLALSFSKDAVQRVIVIDCDLRNPSIHGLLGTSIDPGLLGYLESDQLEAYCYMRRHEKLFLMTAGGLSENPVELLSNARMKQLIAYLRDRFSLIILDCPPFGPISDAQILTGMADGFLMVARRGKTSYGAMGRAIRNMDRSKLIGLVFNDVKPMMFNTQYYHKYYHYKNRDIYPYYSAKTHARSSKTYIE